MHRSIRGQAPITGSRAAFPRVTGYKPNVMRNLSLLPRFFMVNFRSHRRFRKSVTLIFSAAEPVEELPTSLPSAS